MPKQPKVRSNDPNRRKGTRGGAFAALAQQTQGPDATQQYSAAGPELVVNNTTSDNLVVGKTYGGPVGQSTWSELSQLLGAGMQAATTGAQIYGQINEKRERADTESDLEAQKEYELAAAQLEIDIQTLPEDQQHSERGKLLSKFEDRFVTDGGVHKHNLAGLKHELGTSHADSTAWVRTNVTDKVSEARLTYSKDPEALADAITDIYNTASEEIIKRHGKDSKLYSSYMQQIAGGVQSSKSLVKNTAREMVHENRQAIADARANIMQRMSQGEDVLGAMGLDGSSTLGSYAAAIFEEAGIDLTQLDPNQASAVQTEFRDMMLKDLKDDMRALQSADDDRIQKRAANLLSAELEEWDLDRDFTMSESSIDVLIDARQRYAQTGPGREAQAKVDEGIISSFVDGSIVRLDINMSDEDRKKFVTTQVDMMLDRFGHDNDDPISRRVRSRAANMIKNTDFNVIRKHLEKKDHMALLKVGSQGTGPEADLAYKLGMEQLGISMSDYFGQETIMLFNANQRRQNAKPKMSLQGLMGTYSYTLNEDQAGRAKGALGFAFRESVNGGNFEEVLMAELKRDGLESTFEVIMSSVAASDSGQLMHILDQERNDGVGKPKTVKEATDLYKSIGGKVTDGGNLEGGMDVKTSLSRMRESLSSPSGSRAFGASVSEAMGSRPDAMDTAAYEKDVNSFIMNVVAVPGFVQSFQEETDTSERIKMLNAIFTSRYGEAPPPEALGMMEEQIKNGGFTSDDQATIVSDIGSVFARSKRTALNKLVIHDRQWGGDWKNIKDNLDVKASIARFVPPGTEINEFTASGWANKQGLIITRDDDDVIQIAVDPSRSSKDLLMALTEYGPDEERGGARTQGAVFNPAAKKDMIAYAEGTATILDEKGSKVENYESKKSMQLFIQTLVAKPGVALNSRANGTHFKLEGEEARRMEKLRNCIRGKRSAAADTNNLEHGRLAFAAALIAEGIPVEDWNLKTFDLVSADTDGQIMRRGTDGSLTFTIPGESNEAPMTLVVPPAFSGAYGNVTRNRQSAKTGRNTSEAIVVDPALMYYGIKEQIDKKQRGIRDRLGKKASSDPGYIEEWTGREVMPKDAPDDYKHPLYNQHFNTDEYAYD